MASTSETGHLKNVNHLEDLISFCTGFGGAYHPSNPAIQLTALTDLLTNARTELTNVNQKLTDYANVNHARQLKFANLKKLSTRLVNALAASGTNEKTLEMAKSINKKLQGTRVDKKDTPPPPENDQPAEKDKSISVSQQSYGQLAEHFSKLIILLQSEPLYNPNEDDLKLTTLNTLLTELNTNNSLVVNALTEIKNARLKRNDLFYLSANNLHKIVLDVKMYVKSIFGATSPQYKQISGLKFTGLKV